MIGYIACLILLFNLLLHVVLRGLWIGALGLRYVSGDIDYEYLKYSPKFTKHLKNKVGSFDKYISKLETYCSIIFAISFLLIFYVLALAFTIICIMAIIRIFLNGEVFGGTIAKIIGIPLIVFIAFGMILTFIDFATQGWLKKKQWLSKIYFPFYWVFSFVTLSFLYRPIVYNFLDNKFGKRIILALLPAYILILFSSSFTNMNSNYFNRNYSSNSIIGNSSNYEDLSIEDKDFIKRASLPSKVITDRYLKIFMVYRDVIEDDIFSFNQGLKPEKDKRGLTSQMSFTNDNYLFTRVDSLEREYMKTLNEVYRVKIDTTLYESEFILAKNKKRQKGFETYINIKNLPEGKHLMNITRKQITRNKDTSEIYVSRIPFWFYPN